MLNQGFRELSLGNGRLGTQAGGLHAGTDDIF